MPLANKETVIDTLEAIAQMLEMKGENMFKIRAYVNAARALETFTGDFPKGSPNRLSSRFPGSERLLRRR
jgi:DNA polymerase (family 10)